MAAAHSPLSIYIIHILCINASESAGKKHEEGRKERWIWKLPFLGDGGKLREREREIERRKETTCIYIHPAGYGAQLDENDVKRLSARNFSNKTTPVAESRLSRRRRRRRRPRGSAARDCTRSPRYRRQNSWGKKRIKKQLVILEKRNYKSNRIHVKRVE